MRARLLWLLALPAIPYVQARVDGILGAYRSQHEVLYLWSAKHVRRFSPGFENLAADIYWLRTVQYFGGQRLFARDKSFALLYPLIDITTSLDPRLEVAYRYGAIFLSEGPPVGAGRPRDGIGILERGASARPASWRLRQDLGFFRFIYLGDAKAASDTLVEASTIQGAPFWLRTLAADVLAKSGERKMARRMWSEMYQQAEKGILKANAAQQLQILDALDQADTVANAVKEYEKQKGRRPGSLEELSRAGLILGPAVDPAGIPFDYEPGTGVVRVSQRSPLWRMGFRGGA